MDTEARIVSILKAENLDFSVTKIPSFDLSTLKISNELDFPLPTNLRLGHLAEKVVSELIKSSANYNVLYENVQIIEDKKTVGEIDFILEKIATEQIIHIEIAYKFYLFDPTISSESINNWIGPNRNDSLVEKLAKLKSKQFPILHQDCTKSTFKNLNIDEIAQKLCFLVSLFVSYKSKEHFSPIFEKAIQGYYLDFDTFIHLDSFDKSYYLPPKKEWGIEPSNNYTWSNLETTQVQIQLILAEKQAVLCWQKCGDIFTTFFIVWW